MESKLLALVTKLPLVTDRLNDALATEARIMNDLCESERFRSEKILEAEQGDENPLKGIAKSSPAFDVACDKLLGPETLGWLLQLRKDAVMAKLDRQQLQNDVDAMRTQISALKVLVAAKSK